MNLLKRSKSKVITGTITHYTPSIILIFVKKPIYFSAYFNYYLVTICKHNPNISFCLIELQFELDITTQSLRSTFGEFPYYYYRGKIVHLLFFLSSFWRRCRGLLKYKVFILFQLKFFCSSTKNFFFFFFF